MNKLTWPEKQELMEILPLDIQQYVLDLMHEGLSIGNAAIATNLPVMVVAHVVVKQTEHIGYDRIRTTAK